MYIWIFRTQLIIVTIITFVRKKLSLTSKSVQFCGSDVPET